jgi:hypothetical protein
MPNAHVVLMWEDTNIVNSVIITNNYLIVIANYYFGRSMTTIIINQAKQAF